MPLFYNRNKSRIAIAMLMALPVCVLLTNRVGDSWEQALREWLYRIQGKSIPNYAPVFYDAQGIPYAVYASENGITPGKQYNATLVANRALELAEIRPQDQPMDTAAFWPLVHWLDSAMTWLNDTTTIYRFAWRQAWYPEVAAPYTSGMSSGRALEVFAAAFTLSGDSLWLQKARPLVAGFCVPRQAGGFVIPDTSGWWYEEFADSSGPTPRVLDGHLFALKGLLTYAERSGDARAYALYQKGLQGLLRDFSHYDAGSGQVFYDRLGKKADKKYHRLIVSLLEELHAITGHEAFKTYAPKWGRPLKAPYAWRVLQEGNRSGLLLFILLWFGMSILIFFLMRMASGLRNNQLG